jgi:hypothetical protein
MSDCPVGVRRRRGSTRAEGDGAPCSETKFAAPRHGAANAMLSSRVGGLQNDKTAGSPTMRRRVKRRKCVAADGRTARRVLQFESRCGVVTPLVLRCNSQVKNIHEHCI